MRMPDQNHALVEDGARLQLAANLVIDGLAQGEAELRERVAHLEADRDSYRSLAVAALAALATVTTERDRLREYLRREREQHRAIRAQLLQEGAAA
jgi:hypothetical protein